MKQFGGICAALPAACNADGSVNHVEMKKQVRRLIGEGIDGFYVCGSTGENILHTLDERKAILEDVLEANNGEKYVIAHVGAVSTQFTIDLGKHAKAAGADAISSVTPFYYKFSFEEIKQFYFDVMDASDMPLFVYNIPNLSGFAITPKMLDELAAHPNLIGVKYTSNDFFGLERMTAAHPELYIWNGYDEMLLSGLSMGACGGIGSTYNFMCPIIRKIYDCFKAKDLTAARLWQGRANEVIAEVLQCNLFAATKTLLRLDGIDFGAPRKPFRDNTSEEIEKLKALHDRYIKWF